MLRAVGALQKRAEYLQKRINFNLPKGNEIEGAWLRVRDEDGRVTMSLKMIGGDRIEDQKETQLIVDDFEVAKQLLQSIGCAEKAYQETRRELWLLDGVEICIDEWPFLEPFVEIEGTSEAAVRTVAEKLGFDFSLARFCAVDQLYIEKYGIDADRINRRTPRLVFDMENPLIDC